MSAILTIVGPRRSLPDEAEVREALCAMEARGSDGIAIRRAERAVAGVCWYDWETSVSYAGATLIACDDTAETVVVADAALYYRADLRAGLRDARVPVSGDATAELILAAYRAWGENCVHHLEGDYAFVVWDERRGQLFAACDPAGSRPLHYSSFGGCFTVASTLGGLRAMRGFPRELDLVALANLASMFLADPAETCYAGARALPPGSRLTWRADTGETEIDRWWVAPAFAGEQTPSIAFPEAAEHLRQLLVRATEERMPAGEPVAVTLSGGWDSPAVYAVAHSVRRSRGEDARLVRPVSMTFPWGDPGCEDRLIELILGWYDQTTLWIDTEEVSLLGRLAARAATHDQPFAHPFEGTNVALAEASRATGSRICLNGFGGDQLFGSEPVHLSDLLAAGHLRKLVRELRAERLGILQSVDWMVRPRLSRATLRRIGALRGGRPPLAYLERRLPPWIRSDFAVRHDLQERHETRIPARRRGERVEGFERRWLIEHGLYARMAQEVCALSLAAGVEQRMPLFDLRVVAFAATRPREERRSDRETKRLLRGAMAGLLPPLILAPRPRRTGTMDVYFRRRLEAELPSCAEELLRDPLLAQLGIVDAEHLRAAVVTASRGQSGRHDGALVLTLRLEAWLRANWGRSTAVCSAVEPHVVDSGVVGTTPALLAN